VRPRNHAYGSAPDAAPISARKYRPAPGADAGPRREIPFENMNLLHHKELVAHASTRPYTDYEALMQAPPHAEVPTSVESQLPLLELVAWARDAVLDDRERWVLDAVLNRRLSVRDAADEIRIGKTQLCRIRDGALLKLKAALMGEPIVEERLNPMVGPETWEEAALEAAKTLSRSNQLMAWKNDAALLDEIAVILDELAFPYFIEPQGRGSFRGTRSADEISRYCRIGVLALNGLRRHEPDYTLNEVVDLIVRKQACYGHLNIASFGSAGLVVRMSDKRARLENLLGREAPAFESIIDTWADLVGYALIGLMWVDGTFMLDLAAAQ
jgi:hypothetical protein